MKPAAFENQTDRVKDADQLAAAIWTFRRPLRVETVFEFVGQTARFASILVYRHAIAEWLHHRGGFDQPRSRRKFGRLCVRPLVKEIVANRFWFAFFIEQAFQPHQ